MVNVDVVQEIAASANEASKILLDHQNAGRFFDAKFIVAKTADAGEIFGGKGAIRDLNVAGVKFSEQILIANSNHIRYAIVGDRPLKNHQGNIYLDEQNPTLTSVRYTIVCQAPKWLPDKLVEFLLSHAMNKALVKINQHFLALAS
ncbi:MAG: SRPBCC family protein [Cognaticolwellia sp.]